MFQKFLLFFIISFLCASAVSASTVHIDETELAENKTWSFDIPFKENKEKFLLAVHRHHGREYERKEEHHFDFDRDDRWHHCLKDCDHPSPIPIPGSLLLFVSGIAGLIAFAKHKMK